MRYLRDLEYLRLLVPYLAGSGVPVGVRDLATHLSLDADRLFRVLENHPTIFRREAKEQPESSRGALQLRIRSLFFRRKLEPDDSPTYALQIGGGMASAEPVRLLDAIERSADQERRDRRTSATVAASLLTLLALAFLLLQPLPRADPAKEKDPARELDRPASESGGFGSTSGAGRSSSGAAPSVTVECRACPPSTGETAEGGGQTEARPTPGGWRRPAIVAGLFLAGTGFFAWAGRSGSDSTRRVITFGSALSFLGGAAAWAQPALTIDREAGAFHNALAALLLVMVVFAGVLLVSGIVLGRRGRGRAWLAPALLLLVALGAVSLWPGSSWQNVRAGYLQPYLEASAPERLYAWLHLVGGLAGVALAAAAGWWLSFRGVAGLAEFQAPES